MAQIAVGVLGAKGKMGAAVCQMVSSHSNFSLIASCDQGDDLASLLKADVVVDFTSPEAVMTNLEYLMANNKNVVVGTTGFTPERTNQVKEWLRNSSSNVLIAPNFAIGAVLMMKFSQQAANWFESVEILEFHHPAKLDAPSGTAVRTAELIAEARKKSGKAKSPDATKGNREARGAEINDISVHSLRISGLVAHQEVIFGNSGETLSIRHDALDRSSFMPGVALAISEIANYPGLVIGLENYLKLS